MIDVGRLAPGEQWDQNMVDRLLDNQLYPTGLTFERHEGYPAHADGCILIVPGRYWAERAVDISEALEPYRWVLAIRTGDEEDLFTPGAVTHPNLIWWVQTPRPDRDYGPSVRRFFGVGFPPHFNDLPVQWPAKMASVYLSAQDTHERRHQAFAALDRADIPFKQIHRTEGFTAGAPPKAYAWEMQHAKVAPCPAGPVTADTFRVWEALESHTVPIVDTMSPAFNHHGYWDRVLPGAPVTLYSNPRRIPALVDGLLGDPEQANRIAAWWIQKKRDMASWLADDLKALGAL